LLLRARCVPDRVCSASTRLLISSDEAEKTHPDLVPFDQLPEHEKQKD
jgi:hypothetical protein